jgi:cytidylate kinase
VHDADGPHEVVVVSGPPGAGKSTVAAGLVTLLDPSALVAGDDFFAFLRNGAIPPWKQEAHRQNNAVIRAAAAATGHLADHCAVVYDGVLGPWFLRTFLQASDLRHVHYAVLLPPLAVCLERVRSRSGHGFTDLDAAEHMWQDFQKAEIHPRHLVSDHTSHPTAVARSLAERLTSGTIRYP